MKYLNNSNLFLMKNEDEKFFKIRKEKNEIIEYKEISSEEMLSFNIWLMINFVFSKYFIFFIIFFYTM